jgi:hypothetical protein
MKHLLLMSMKIIQRFKYSTRFVNGYLNVDSIYALGNGQE